MAAVEQAVGAVVILVNEPAHRVGNASVTSSGAVTQLNSTFYASGV
jgi:hypothetical protein